MSWAQLDPSLARPGGRALREDVEDELRAVDDAEIDGIGDRSGLRRVKIAVEDDEADVVVHGLQHELVELSAPHDVAGIGDPPPLDDRVDDRHAGRASELTQLRHGVVRIDLPPVRDVNEDGPFAVALDLAVAALQAELALEGLDELVEAEVERVPRDRRQLRPHRAVARIGGSP